MPHIRQIILGPRILHFLSCRIEDEVDFRNLEASDFDLEPHGDEALQLDLEDFLVPARLLGQTIVGDHECALLHFGEAGCRDRRHGAQPKQIGRREPPVPSKDDALLVGQNRYEVAKRLDALGDLPDLSLACVRGLRGLGVSESGDRKSIFGRMLA